MMKLFAATALAGLVAADDQLQEAIRVKALKEMRGDAKVKKSSSWMTALRQPNGKRDPKTPTPTFKRMVESLKAIKDYAENFRKTHWKKKDERPSEQECDEDKKTAYAAAFAEFKEEQQEAIEKACTDSANWTQAQCQNAKANKDAFLLELEVAATWDGLRALRDFHQRTTFSKHTLEHLPLEWLVKYYKSIFGVKKDDEKEPASFAEKELAPLLTKFLVLKGGMDDDDEDTPTDGTSHATEKTTLAELQNRISYFVNTWAAKLEKDDLITLRKEMEKIWKKSVGTIPNAESKELQSMKYYLELTPISKAMGDVNSPTESGTPTATKKTEEATPTDKKKGTDDEEDKKPKNDDDSTCFWVAVIGISALVLAGFVVAGCCLCGKNDHDEL